VFVVILQFIVLYAVVFAVWGFALRQSVLLFAIIGGVIAIIPGFLSYSVAARKGTKEGTREMMFAAGAIWGSLALLLGVLGVVVWLVRVLFF
jgi:hypothetical protein